MEPRRLREDQLVPHLTLMWEGLSHMQDNYFLPHLVDRAQSEPTATMYLAGAQPT